MEYFVVSVAPAFERVFFSSEAGLCLCMHIALGFGLDETYVSIDTEEKSMRREILHSSRKEGGRKNKCV